MRIKHQPLLPNPDKPFEACKLNREEYANVLTSIVSTYADGFVLAINNAWGTGKTTFVQMWQQSLIKQEFKTLYFNAWENDFDSNPLVAIMSELSELKGKDNAKAYKSVVEKGAVLVKHIAPALLKALVKKHVADIGDVVADAVENAATATTSILEEEIKEFNTKKKTIQEFRNELSEFVQKVTSDKPLVFIIDELDRCRPTYAVEVLEQIKHLFSVKGIVFVLSIDKKHLASSIKGFYGSEEINSEDYLRRFIDLEYSIPEPSADAHLQYLYEYYQLGSFFNSAARQQHSVFANDSSNLLQIAKALFAKSNATLRQKEQVFAQTRLILRSFSPNQYTFSPLLFLLIFAKFFREDVFHSIARKQLSLQALSDAFFDILGGNDSVNYQINFVYIEAMLLWFYNNSLPHSTRFNLIEEDETQSISTPINSKLDSKEGKHSLANCFKHIKQEWDYRDMELNQLINRINLTQPLNTL